MLRSGRCSIIPPWINKFYILDLREKNSFISWAVDQGITVFVVSWVNPDAKLADKDFEDYLTDGTMAALDAIEKATGESESQRRRLLPRRHAARGHARLHGGEEGQAHRERDVHDVADRLHAAGELEVFIDEEQVASLERKMAERGYLEGSEMANTFNMLRANDLIWSFVINNYLLGRDPFPFDLLHWNCDSTRMPAKMHSFYLRNMYMKNLLRKPGGIELDGVTIDLTKVERPRPTSSPRSRTTSRRGRRRTPARVLGGKSRFVLSGSGHIAGIVNPPAANKYGYWTNDERPDDPDAWLEGAKQHEGSWWVDWRKWLAPHLGKEVPARVPGKGKLKVLEAAPGSYARLRADAG